MIEPPDVSATMRAVSIHAGESYQKRAEGRISASELRRETAIIQRAARKDAIAFALAVLDTFPCTGTYPSGMYCSTKRRHHESLCRRDTAIAELERMRDEVQP